MGNCPIPANKDDLASAQRLLNYGGPISNKNYRHLIDWLKDSSWAVFPLIAEFFSQQGVAAENAVLYVMNSKNSAWKKNVIEYVLSTWPKKDLETLPFSLINLITDSDIFGPDIVTAQVLMKHKLVDLDWLMQWLEFKRSTLLGKLGEIESCIKQIEN